MIVENDQAPMTNVKNHRCGGLVIGHWSLGHSLVIGHWSLDIRFWSLVIFSCFCFSSAFAIDFSAPLQNVQASLSGSTVNYSVFDPGRGIFVSGSANTPAGYISTPTANGGVVSWLAGN